MIALAIRILGAAPVARADSFDPRVMVLPVEGEAPRALGKLARDVGDALAKGARDTDAEVARADATLADTAGIVGCEPSARDCVDAVAAALNVDQLLVATISADGDDATVEVTAITRETEPLTQTFTVRKRTRKADLRAIRDAVGGMLEEGEARRAEAAAVDPPDEPGGADAVPDDADDDPGRGTIDATRGRTTEARPSAVPKILVIAGAAVVAIGLTSWALAAGVQGDIDEAPTATAADLDALTDLEHAMAIRANVGNAFVVTGAIAIAAGAAWWLHDRGERRRAAVTVTALPSGAGVAIGGAW